MKLLHVTDEANRESIISKGLLASYKPYKDTEEFRKVLHKHKPEKQFSQIDIRKCSWFTPGNSTYRFQYYEDPLKLAVPVKSLDQDKLYFVDGRIAEKIGKSTGRTQEEYCHKFWDKLKPFSEYLILFGETEELTRSIDVLYFDDIPPEKLEVFIET